MDDKMYLTATAQGEVKVTGGRAEEKLGARLQRIGKEFGFFGVLSIFYGVSASFCLFRNPLGITVPLFVAVTYGAAFLIFRKMGVPIKKDSYLLAAVSLLIGLSACFTGNMAVGYYMNRLALILLFCIFIRLIVHIFLISLQIDLYSMTHKIVITGIIIVIIKSESTDATFRTIGMVISSLSQKYTTGSPG